MKQYELAIFVKGKEGPHRLAAFHFGNIFGGASAISFQAPTRKKLKALRNMIRTLPEVEACEIVRCK